MWLKFYETEQKVFNEEYHIFVTDTNAMIITKKLCRHFKFPVPVIKFFGIKQRGAACKYIKKIRVPHNTSVGLLCHELAHKYNRFKYNDSKHSKRLMRTITRFLKYCKSKDYWVMNLNATQ